MKFPKFQTGILLNGKRPRSKLRDKDDVKQKTSLFSVQGKICLVFSFLLFYVICVR